MVPERELFALQVLEPIWREQGISLYPHQIETVQTVLGELGGRALLADEVGLGKTIEAGFIIKELLLRGAISNFLILVPASLGFQWCAELKQKFNIDAFFNRKGRAWDYFKYQIASLDKAKRSPHRERLLQMDWDLVVVDEAHRLKNDQTVNWQFVNDLKKRYCLLLTATPIHNNLKELYNLIKIVRPDIFRDYKEFKDRFVEGKRGIKNTLALQKKLEEVMIRNQRRDTPIDLPERKTHLIPLELTDKEWELYARVTEFVKRSYRKSAKNRQGVLHLLTLQREVCSSSFAVRQTLRNMLYRGKVACRQELEELLQLADEITINAKLLVVEEILKKIKRRAIIFTEYRATQYYICRYLESRGISTLQFNGGMSSAGKMWAKIIFQNNKDVLVSTEAGSQGLNFQFCDTIINYDLPWNPMKLEQRIGRVHRLGQRNTVNIYNLSTRGTIEEKIINLLYEKTNLFNTVLGSSEDILAGETYIEGNILDILMTAENEEELERGFAQLSSSLGPQIIKAGATQM